MINKSDKVLVSYVVRVVLSTVISVLFYSYIFSLIAYKLDLSLSTARSLTVYICFISSVTIALSSVLGLKNNGALMGLISQLPLIVYSLCNLIFNNNSLVMFIIKAVICLLTGVLVGFVVTNRKKRYKVK